MKCLLLLAAVLAALGFAAGAHADADSATHYYLSLGDSLAEGFQPNGDFSHGYAEQFYASLVADQPKLRLVKLGSGGESTVSMRFGNQDRSVVVFWIREQRAGEQSPRDDRQGCKEVATF